MIWYGLRAFFSVISDTWEGSGSSVAGTWFLVGEGGSSELGAGVTVLTQEMKAGEMVGVWVLVNSGPHSEQ